MLQAPAVCGLFAGAGGFELGLKRAGFATSALCEINPAAQAVLRSQFPSAKLHADVLTLDSATVPDTVAGSQVSLF